MPRGVAAAILCAALLGLTIGLAMPLTAAVLARQGVGETAIGLNATAQFLGIMAGAPLAPRLVPRFGLRAVMMAALAACARSTTASGLLPGTAAVLPVSSPCAARADHERRP
jgi:MFS family permease